MSTVVADQPAPDRPEADRIPGAPHPRDTPRLFGQDGPQAAFLDAFTSGRLHHGWLITGPRGVGKATLAWRIARFLLATPIDDGDGLFGAAPAPGSLDVAADDPVARRVAARSDPGLLALTRPYDEKAKRLRQQITVDEVRRLRGFFGLSAADGGRRVVIVDAADDMNPNAANALLKLLEEPPENAHLLLVSHQPTRLLPTIRSRCRELRLAPLGTDDMRAALDQAGLAPGDDAMALAELSGGSVGAAVRIGALDGIALYAELVALVAGLPRLDRPRALKLAETAAARGREERFELLLGLVDLLLARLARTGATGAAPGVQAAPGESTLLNRLSPSPRHGRDWAELAQEIGLRTRHGRAVNLDPAALVLDTLFKIQSMAEGTSAAPGRT